MSKLENHFIPFVILSEAKDLFSQARGESTEVKILREVYTEQSECARMAVIPRLASFRAC